MDSSFSCFDNSLLRKGVGEEEVVEEEEVEQEAESSRQIKIRILQKKMKMQKRMKSSISVPQGREASGITMACTQ